MKRNLSILLVSLAIFFNYITVVHAEGELELNWIEGETTVELDTDLATLHFNENYLFLNKEDTVVFNEAIGNFETGLEIGSIYPRSEEEDWFIIFEYEPIGHVKDADKEEIDANAILETYKKGNEEYNQELEEQGFSPIHVIGWTKEPYFDSETQNLTWAMELESEGESIVNYNVRLLNRYGYVSAILVADSKDLDRLIPEVNQILKGFSFQEGQRYEDFNPATDKIAEYGLAALITGGIGAAAAKKGLLAALLVFAKKFGIVIIAGIGGVFAFIKKKVNSEK